MDREEEEEEVEEEEEEDRVGTTASVNEIKFPLISDADAVDEDKAGAMASDVLLLELERAHEYSELSESAKWDWKTE